jgi:hypothetical protein
VTCLECAGEVYARGLCRVHYQRFKRTGSPQGTGKSPQSKDFPGYGKILCLICDEPLRDHAIAPCPHLEGERIATTGSAREARW